MDSRNSDVRIQLLKGFSHQFRAYCSDPPYPGSRLHGQGRDARNPVTAVGGDRLYIRCHPRSGRGVKPCDAENHGRRLGHKANLTEINAVANYEAWRLKPEPNVT